MMQSPLSSLGARLRSLWHGIRRRDAVESDMAEEFRLHQELRAADLVRAGLAPAAAARQARLEFGSAERYKEEGRRSRGLRRVDELRISWLDVRLGARMLVRYPGLAVVGGFAFAFAIAVGAAGFELITQAAAPSLPLPDGERIVAIRVWDPKAADHDRRLAHEFTSWLPALRSVEALGAHRTVGRNLVVPGGEVASVPVAEISAAAFRVATVPPLLGRALQPADERPASPPVLVVGHDAWQRRFAGDPTVVGRVVMLDGVPHTIVGVMPEGFAFPYAHEWWTPLRLGASGYAPGEGPSLEIFGRLAPGVTVSAAQAELSALAGRESAGLPAERARLRPEIVPLAETMFTVRLGAALRALIASANLPLLLFLVLVCGNVAMLVFARAATREGELVVRTALGASRSRIVMQLFAEALVLGAAACVFGLAAAGYLLRVGMGAADTLPFWFSDRLSPATVLYAVLLTVVGAAIAGVVPALKVTRGLAARLRAASAGGGGVRFGGIWTAVIVSQVAVTTVFPIFAYATWRSSALYRSLEATFPSGEYLAARLAMDPVDVRAGVRDSAAERARFQAARAELARRLAEEPAVLGVTAASALPLAYHPWRRVEVEGIAPPVGDTSALPRVSQASVEPGFFAVFGAPALVGRTFDTRDHAPDARAVVVNEAFVAGMLGGRNPIGRRLRYTMLEEWNGRPPADAEPARWFEIVGVVRDLGMKAGGDPRQAAGVYHPAPPGAGGLAQLALHLRGDPTAFAPRLRELAAAVDPTLRLDGVVPMDELQAGDLTMQGYILRLLVVVSLLALTLSLAGVYAVTSFTVARRTREIGIRVALGADPRRLAVAVVRRPITQAGLGVLLGCTLLGLLQQVTAADGLSPRALLVLLGCGGALFGTCLLACVLPMRRALAVEPTEALRADG